MSKHSNKLSITEVNFSDRHQKINAYEVCALIIAFVVVRCVLVIGLYLLTGGQELASDVVFHERIIKDPLGILNGTAFEIASYPPFQWLVEWSLFNLFNLYFGEMVSYRLLMVTVEFIAFICAIVVCLKITIKKMIALSILILFIISPHQYFSSIFFIQEDVIAQLFMLIAMLFLLQKKRNLCILTLVLGVLIAKLFFIVPLFYVILFQGHRLFVQRVLDGFIALIPIAIVYIFTITQALSNGGEVPIRDFTPDAKYAANYWVLLIDSDPVLLKYYKNVSLVFTASVQFILISAFLFISWKRKQPMPPLLLLFMPLAFFFGTFYQHMPEYLLMLWPVAALLCNNVWQQLVLVAALSFSWTPRIFHGFNTVVDGFGTAAEARSQVLGPLVDFLNLDFVFLNQAALVSQSVVYTIVVFWLCLLGKKLLQRDNTD